MPHESMPARVERTGKRQVSFQLSDEQAAVLERLRQRQRARSWGEVIRRLIDHAGKRTP